VLQNSDKNYSVNVQTELVRESLSGAQLEVCRGAEERGGRLAVVGECSPQRSQLLVDGRITLPVAARVLLTAGAAVVSHTVPRCAADAPASTAARWLDVRRC